MKDIRLLDKIKQHLFSKEYNKEFVAAVNEKVGGEVKTLTLLYDGGKEFPLKKVVACTKDNLRGEEPYISEEGMRRGASYFNRRKYEEKGFKAPEGTFLKELSLKESNELNNLDGGRLDLARDAISSSFQFGKKMLFKDKDGEEYDAVFMINNDPTINFPAIVDDLRLYNKKGEEVAYLLTKYYTEESVDAERKRGREVDSRIVDLFLNKATVDYIRIREDCQGKGLAQLMYINMAQFLKDNNRKFRSSTLRSSEAKRTWGSLTSKLENKYYKEEDLEHGKVIFLDIPTELSITSYNDIKTLSKNTPKRKTKSSLNR